MPSEICAHSVVLTKQGWMPVSSLPEGEQELGAWDARFRQKTFVKVDIQKKDPGFYFDIGMRLDGGKTVKANLKRGHKVALCTQPLEWIYAFQLGYGTWLAGAGETLERVCVQHVQEENIHPQYLVTAHDTHNILVDGLLLKT